MKAYSYLRWSSDKQTMGDSLKRQTEITEKLCRERGWELDKLERVDKGVSAFRGANIEHGPLAEFIYEVENKKIETPCVLVVEAMDRLSRANLITARNLLEKLIELDVSICTANNNKVYDKTYLENPYDMIFSLVEMNIAHEYSKNLGRRSKAAWKRKKDKAREGTVLTRRLPAWIHLPKGKKSCNELEIIEEKAKIVKRIFKEYLEGKGSRTIALKLTKEGIQPFGKSKEWNVSSVFKVLNSKSVIGEYQPTTHLNGRERISEGSPIENYYPAVIDKVTFYRAQENIKKKLVPRGPKRNLFNLLSGIVYCKKCSGNMILKTGAVTKKRKYPYLTLVCAKGWKGGNCDYRSIRYEMIEESILTVFSKNIIIDLTEVRKNNAIIKKAKKLELKEIEATLQRLINATRDTDLKVIPRSLVKSISEYESKLDSLQNDLNILENTPEILLDGIAGWNPIEETVENRMKLQMILRSIIEKIIIDAENQNAMIFARESTSQPPINIEWKKENRLSFLLNGEATRYDYKGNIWKKNKLEQSEFRKIPDRVLTNIRKNVKENIFIMGGRGVDIITFMGENIECEYFIHEGERIYLEKKPRNNSRRRCFYNVEGNIFSVLVEPNMK